MQECIATDDNARGRANVRSKLPPKRLSEWEQWDDEAGTGAISDVGDMELQRYLAQPVPEECDILSWWKQNSSAYPYLSQVARRVLSCPARSASSERAFSRMRELVTYKRSRLKPRTLDDLMIVAGC